MDKRQSDKRQTTLPSAINEPVPRVISYDIDTEDEIDAMEDEADNQALYDELDKLVQTMDNKKEDIDSEDLKGNLKEKLQRYKKILQEKTKIMIETRKKLTVKEKLVISLRDENTKLSNKIDLLEQSTSKCGECDKRDKVIRNKDNLIDKREEDL